MVLTVAMPRRRVRRHVLAPLGGDGQEQGSARRQRFGCARGARDARARPTVSARCCCDARAPTPTSSPTRALPRLTRARVLPRSSSSSTLCAKIRRTLESRPHPICPHRRTQGARTRTSRGPPTAQDPPAHCVTPLALFDTFRSRAYHSYPTGIHTFGHVLRAGRLSFVANKRCASDERRRAWRLAGIASGRWAAGGFAPVREMAECAVRRAPLPLTAVADRHRCWALAAAARGCCGRRARGRREEGRRAPALPLVVTQAGRAPAAPLVVMKAAAC